MTHLDWEKISKYVKVLDLFCQATVLLGSQDYVSCSCVLPLLTSLKKHMTVCDDDPCYITRFKAASINTHNAHKKTVATAGDGINNETICEPNEKRIKLMESDSDTENDNNSSDELLRYKMEMKVPESVDPLQWWKLNEHRYPKLSFLAKTILCIQATSVPCERLFSLAGYIVNKTRSSLEPNNVNKLVCLRSWLKDDI